MKNTIPLFAISLTLFLAACRGSKLGYNIKNETVKMNITEAKDVINYPLLEAQQIPTFSQRIEKQKSGKTNFGFGDQAAFVGAPIVGNLVSLATDGIKKMIENDKKKFTANYSFALTNLYFYDQLSTESAFDPVGMQFSGFTLVRTFKNTEGNIDTALVAEFGLDNANPYEIINDAVFRLKLKKLDLRYAKAKVPKDTKQHLNMDFEIAFTSSYVNEHGQLFDNVTLGKFYLLLREMPLNKNEKNYTEYYDKLKGKLLDGKSFIVPRSFGYYLSGNNVKAKCFSQGAYSVTINVKESSKNSFINKIIIDNSNDLLKSANDQLKKSIQ
jgi:hypothetical protein